MRSQTRRSSVKAIVLSPSPVRGCAAPGDGDFFLISPLENKIIVAYNIIIRRFSGRGRKTVFGNSLACFGGAGRLLSRRSQKACGRQQVPNFILSKRQDSPCENCANGRGTGTERNCANLVRPRECRMKAGSRFPRHLAARHGTPCGRKLSPASASRGEWLAKRQTGFARGRTPSRAGKKPSEALFFSSFRTRRKCLAAKKFRLCGRRFVSLRKAILLLPQKNDRRDGEMLHTNSSSTRFLTVRPLFTAVRPVIETRKRKESLSS